MTVMAAIAEKIVLTAFVAVLSCAAALAQSPLDRLYHAFSSSCVELALSYEGKLGKTLLKGEATLLVQGDSYLMSGNGLDVFCDGESVWTVDHDALEAVVETAENGTGAAWGNPALLIVRLDELFYVRNASSSGNRYRYELSAKEDCGIKKADVDVTSAGILLGVEFTMSDGTAVKVEVVSMKSLMNKPSDAFRPGFVFGPDWTVTDLR